ncbi:MAG: M15 family metallopeptidase [Butyrivibrio sp.]|nr:M15 family metallopeptidase [Butyrivibrio sp.]
MNIADLSMKTSFKQRVLREAKKFIRKHKYLTVPIVLITVILLTINNVFFFFYSNTKKFICLASVVFFFVASSSFSYPSLSLDVSFVSNTSIDEREYNTVSSDEILPADAVNDTVVLAQVEEIDPALSAIPEDTVVDEIDMDENGTVETYSLEDLYISESDSSATELSSENSGDSEEDAVNSISYNAENSNDISSESSEDSDNKKFSKDDWKIILVNKQHPIPDDYEFPLGDLNANMHCDQRIISSLFDMFTAASADGVNLIICSPYRNRSRQEMLFANKIDYYMEAGFSYMDAYNLSSQAVTIPGSSEHQIGLAIDIISDTYSSLDENFGDTLAGKWLAENSYKYGFTLRYPAGKENITSIEYEPWHFRYVGVDAATVMYEEGICLEEFWSEYLYD